MLGAGERLIFTPTVITAAPTSLGARQAIGRRSGAYTHVRRRAGRSLLTARLWLWATVIVWMGSPLQLYLSGVDPSAPAAAQATTPLYRYARYACALLPLLALARRPEATLRLARAAWPLGAFLLYAAASWLWSNDRNASVQGLMAAAPTLVTAAGAAVALRPGRLAQALLLALALCALGSLIAVLWLPHFAVAGPHDVVGASAPGDWRGLYLHKNTLGHVAGLAAAGLATRGGRLVRPAALRWAGLAAAVACVAASRSVSGLTLALGLPIIDQLLIRPRGMARLAIGGFVLAAMAAAFAGRAMILAAGLAALGRDATLSGRTAIWRAAAELAPRHALAGWGLNYSVSPEVAARLTALFGVNHVHNALLDVFINLGAAGVGLLALAVAGALWAGARAATSASAAGRATLGLIAAGWLLSGLTEDMAVRSDGPMAQFGLCAILGLYGLKAARTSFRRPVFHFQPAWRAPLRPPRLATGAPR